MLKHIYAFHTSIKINITAAENSKFHSSAEALYRKLIIIYGSIGMKI